jgi:hypothetical protein
MHLFDLSSTTRRNALIAAAIGMVAATAASDALAAGPANRGAAPVRGGGGPILTPAPQTPMFNPSVPYTVPQAPESPVSPASPGSVFGNG